MSEFGFETELDVRWSDFDSLGHVNHAAYASYCEHARLKYLEEVLGLTLEGIASGAGGRSLVIANLSIDYRYPISEPDTVTVAMGVSELGSSSIGMEYELRAEGEVAAAVGTTMVAVDPATGSSTPLPAEWVDAIDSFEDAEFDRD